MTDQEIESAVQNNRALTIMSISTIPADNSPVIVNFSLSDLVRLIQLVQNGTLS